MTGSTSAVTGAPRSTGESVAHLNLQQHCSNKTALHAQHEWERHMPVIDIDTHFEPGRSWLGDHPDLAAQLPEYSVATATVRAQVGDLLAAVPVEDRPPLEDLLPPGIAAILGHTKIDGYGFEGSAMHTQTDASSRLAWMDRVGIDMANTICMEAAGYARYLEDRDLARRAVS